MAIRARIPVRIHFDDEARQAAAAAVAFALESEPDPAEGAQFEYLDVAVA